MSVILLVIIIIIIIIILCDCLCSECVICISLPGILLTQKLINSPLQNDIDIPNVISGLFPLAS